MNKNAPAIQVAVSMALFSTIIIAGFNAWSEAQVARLVALRNTAAQSNAPSVDYYSLLSAQDYVPTARGALMVGSLLTRAADDANGERAMVFAEGARAYLDQAEAQRPDWAQVTLVRLYAQRKQALSNTAASAGYLLRLSYRQAPYLAKEGPWRISQIIRHWNEVDDATRNAAASEAVYLASLSRADRVHIRLIVSNTPLSPLFGKYLKEF